MRIGVIIGVILIALGGWAASGNAAYRSKRDVIKVGELEASVREEHTVPSWAGYLAIGAGVLVLVTTFKRR